MKQGFFITLEGPDGSGKSTQAAYLKKYFEEKEIPCVFTREPGGTLIGEKLRTIILDKENADMCPMTEALLYAASRAQHIEQLIRPALSEGKVVVCDRFIDSSIAYQGYGRNLGESVRTINELAVGGCMPDLTFFMDLAPDLAKSRIDEKNRDRLESEKMDFHDRVYRGYLKIAEIYPQRFVPIDALQGKEAIRDEIIQRIESALTSRASEEELCR